MVLQCPDGTGGQTEIPYLNDGRVIVLGGQAELGGDLRVPGHDLGTHSRRRVADLDDGVVLAQVPHHATRREGRGQNVLDLISKRNSN